MLSSNADIPPEFSRPEVVAILKEYYAGLGSAGQSASIMIIAQISDTHLALDTPDADQRIAISSSQLRTSTRSIPLPT